MRVHCVLRDACKTHTVIQTRESDKQTLAISMTLKELHIQPVNKALNIANGFLKKMEIEYFSYPLSNGISIKALYEKYS